MVKVDLVQVPRVGYRFKITGVHPSRLRDIYTANTETGLTNTDPLVVKQMFDQFGKDKCLVHPQILSEYEAYCKKVEDIHNARDIDPGSFNWGDVVLTPDQVAGVYFMKSAGDACILADDMGLGKTLTTLALTRQMSKVLAVSPKTAKYNWYGEAEKWNLNGQLVVIDGSTRAVKNKRLDKAIQHGVQYIAVHYDMLEEDKYPALFSTRWDCILFDEAHYMKSREQRDANTGGLKGGRKHAAAKKLKADKKIFMSGTVFCNNAGDVWSMLNMIDPKRFGSYWTFVKQFANVEDTYFGVTVKGVNARHVDDLRWLLRRYMIRREKDIESKKIFKYHHLEFGEEQKAAYLKAKQEYAYNDEVIESDVEKFIRMLQISTDPYILDINAPSVTNDNILELVDIHKDSKIIIGCVNVRHTVNLWRLLEQSREVFVVTGEATNKKDIVDRFKSSKKDSILIATITSITESLSIDECDIMILADLTFSPTKNCQFFDRIHRLNSTRDKTYHVLVTEGVNDDKQDILKEKHQMIDALMAGKSIDSDTPDDIRKYLMEKYKNNS